MKHVIAVASGKGGVGKSTVATNLAVALANLPHEVSPQTPKVALVDVDFYGPSVPTLMGGGKISVDHQEKFIPASKYNVKYISIAFFLQNPDDPIVWRGPMFSKAINQLFQDVNWGEVDYCIIDMPPGTGDAQLSLAQSPIISLTGALIVTTPQEVALSDVRRAINMFRKVNVEPLGIIENMAGFITPSGEHIDIFGQGGGQALADQYNIPFLASIPLEVAIREGGDKGEPVAINAETLSGGLYRELAIKFIDIVKSREDSSKDKVLQVIN